MVKVLGTAPGCARRIEGSGFVFAPEHVMTNAHVVAGVRDGPDVYTKTGRRLRARVVLYDFQRDVAVLYVPGLHAAALAFAGPAQDRRQRGRGRLPARPAVHGRPGPHRR